MLLALCFKLFLLIPSAFLYSFMPEFVNQESECKCAPYLEYCLAISPDPHHFNLANCNLKDLNDFIDLNYQLYDYTNQLNEINYLNLDDNHFDTIDVYWMNKLINIEYLWMKRNRLMELKNDTFLTNDLIKLIDLSGNEIWKIDGNTFTTLNRLEMIDLSFNNLTYVDKGTFLLPNLILLNLNGNDFFKIDLLLFTEKSEYIGLLNDKLTHVNLTDPLYLYKNVHPYNLVVEIHHDRLKSFNYDLLKPIERFEVINKNLTNLDGFNFAPNTLTGSLDFSNNRLRSFNKTYEFDGLNELYLRRNEITVLRHESFDSLPNLKLLDVSFNRLVKLVKPFVKLNKIEIIQMENNRLDRFDLILPSNLITIDLSTNNLTTIDSETFSKATKLLNVHLTDNKLIDLAPNIFVENTELFEVDLSGNRFRCLPPLFIKSNRIVRMNLSNNLIDELPNDFFVNQTHLIVLDLSFNRIKRLKNGFLNGALNLRHLNLSNNLLSVMEPFIFYNNNHLSTLRLNDNDFLNLDAIGLCKQLNNLSYLTLNGNRWNCNVLGDILNYLRTNGVLWKKGVQNRVENIQGIACVNFDQSSKSVATMDTRNVTLEFPKEFFQELNGNIRTTLVTFAALFLIVLIAFAILIYAKFKFGNRQSQFNDCEGVSMIRRN